jgi:catechol 2,3-dioxygenase-like lactoylglutathione lyase family enzyme
MLQQTDRLALAVPDADEAATGLNAIFDSVVVDDSVDADANARRITLQWGRDQLELYEPKGPGPVADFVGGGKRGLFAGGFALDDPASVAARIEQAGIKVTQQGDRFVIYPGDLRGTGVILSPTAERESRVGLMDKIWQITYTVQDLEESVAFYSDLLGVEDKMTNLYTSDAWGYHAAITWFEAKKGAPLDSLEYLEPYEHEKAAGRFLAKTEGVGGIYMSTAHTPDLQVIRERIESTGGGWDGAADAGLGFIHPRRTYGLLLGVTYFENIDARRPTPEDPNAWDH